jgi:LmbE family N-acetylglucosaminyl deacetylase
MSIPDSYRVDASSVAAAISVDLPTPARALAIGAHPDDVEFGCGGTLAKWAADGCRIFHLILTDGSKGTWDANVDPAELVVTRRREQIAAASALGGRHVDDVAFLGHVDGELDSGLRERAEVCFWIRRFAPDVVLGHDPWKRYRIHPDHRHAGLLATEAIVAARDPKFFPEQSYPPHRPHALLLWEADQIHHVESFGEAAIDAKVRALLAHRSQYETTMHIADVDHLDAPANDSVADFRRTIVEEAEKAGRPAGGKTGEAFALLNSL